MLPPRRAVPAPFRSWRSAQARKVLLVHPGIPRNLGCYAAWRLFDAVTGPRGVVRRIASLGVPPVVYGALWVQGRGTRRRSFDERQGIVQSRTLGRQGSWGWSGGTVEIEVAGAVLVGGGVALGGMGVFHLYGKHLALERLSPPVAKRRSEVLGEFGDLARGILARSCSVSTSSQRR